MKIGIIAASGKSGLAIMKEAIVRGHDVTAIVRDAKKVTLKNTKVIEKDLFDLKYDDLQKFDAVVDAFGAWTPDLLPLHEKSVNHLCDILSGKPNRLLVVGSAGTLYLDKDHKMRLLDSPDMPEMFLPLATAMAKAFDGLGKRTDVKWTFFSPAVNFAADGKRTNKYTLGGDELIVNSNGESYISYPDYAVAMVDEIEKGKFIGKRFTAVAE